ncbi:hypothetical protein VDG60_21550, partial [Xanthomonas campestris pv. raphani]|nr:hypothetical protein [Xanthomonas campestris pv. raphani]
PKIQTRLSRAMRHPALSGLIVQTFLRLSKSAVDQIKIDFSCELAEKSSGIFQHFQYTAAIFPIFLLSLNTSSHEENDRH